MKEGLSIIIPTLNEEYYLPKLLQSIAEQQFKGDLEVVVVDGRSTDATVLKAKEFSPHFKLETLSTNADIGHQRNLGAAKARYAHLLFLDADVVLPPIFLDSLTNKTANQENVIVSVRHIAQDMSIGDRFFLSLVYALFVVSWIAGTPVTNGDCIFTTKKSHDRIRGFKEGAKLGEDTDYGIRAVKAGVKYRFFFNPPVIASDRRVREMGRWRLLKIWSRAFLKARKEGPTYDLAETYPFGHYRNKN